MHLQCFPPTRYVRGGATRAHERDDHYPLYCIGCLLALYGSTMHPVQLCSGFRTIFFLLSVLVALKKKKKIVEPLPKVVFFVFFFAHAMGK